MRSLSSTVNDSRTPFVNAAEGACAASERGCSGYFCHVNAGVTDVGLLFAELVKFQKWTSVNVLYDESAGKECLYAIIVNLSRATNVLSVSCVCSSYDDTLMMCIRIMEGFLFNKYIIFRSSLPKCLC